MMYHQCCHQYSRYNLDLEDSTIFVGLYLAGVPFNYLCLPSVYEMPLCFSQLFIQKSTKKHQILMQSLYFVLQLKKYKKNLYIFFYCFYSYIKKYIYFYTVVLFLYKKVYIVYMFMLYIHGRLQIILRLIYLFVDVIVFLQIAQQFGRLWNFRGRLSAFFLRSFISFLVKYYMLQFCNKGCQEQNFGGHASIRWRTFELTNPLAPLLGKKFLQLSVKNALKQVLDNNNKYTNFYPDTLQQNILIKENVRKPNSQKQTTRPRAPL
eukprot:TRINITY_DN8691_c0_g1_i8.p3 TRINITY_DN8691_c0_g1~~TRINITY_DN8691_c0_g1_i8.p3  ORF type:complete len:264 (-),score=-19.02 TRINITY_DN8691_c0_g1_i8:32-823(-)